MGLAMTYPSQWPPLAFILVFNIEGAIYQQ